MIADHLLHATLGAEGYWRYRLECLPGHEHFSWSEKANGCDCDCEMCSGDDPDHAGCEVHGGNYIENIGYECQADREDECWVHYWLSEIGDECIDGDDWPEDSLPLPVRCEYDEGLIIRFAPDRQVSEGS